MESAEEAVSVGQAALALHFEARTCRAFLAALKAALAKCGYSWARQELQQTAARWPGDFGLFALECLALCGAKQDLQAAALLSDLGPGLGESTAQGEDMLRFSLGERGEEHLRVLLGLPMPGLRFVLKVLQAWGVERPDSLGEETRQALSDAMLRELRSGTPAAAAAALCQWPELLDPPSQQSVLEALDDCKDREDLAVRLAGSLGRESQLSLVHRRQASGRLRAAARAVGELGLQADFPNADLDWRRTALASALAGGAREAAVGLVYSEPRLHEACSLGLLAAGEPELAVELARAWQVALPPEADARLQEARAERELLYLALPAAFEVRLVDAEEALPQMRTALLEADGVGLDSESSLDKAMQPCMLQLATQGAAHLVDLCALGTSRALAEVLAALMSRPDITKVGFGLHADLNQIAGKLPTLACCRDARNLADVGDLERQRLAQERGISNKQAKEGLSLSSLAQKYLGRPLDKAMRVSDWRHRPLSPSQLHYAALDAWVPLRVLQLQRSTP